MLNKYDIKKAVRVHGALANETRYSVFQLLLERPEEKIRQGDIAKILAVPPQTLSFHLKEMYEAGVVLQERDGVNIFYFLNKKILENMAGYLNLQLAQVKNKKFKFKTIKNPNIS